MIALLIMIAALAGIYAVISRPDALKILLGMALLAMGVVLALAFMAFPAIAFWPFAFEGLQWAPGLFFWAAAAASLVGIVVVSLLAAMTAGRFREGGSYSLEKKDRLKG